MLPLRGRVPRGLACDKLFKRVPITAARAARLLVQIFRIGKGHKLVELGLSPLDRGALLCSDADRGKQWACHGNPKTARSLHGERSAFDNFAAAVVLDRR